MKTFFGLILIIGIIALGAFVFLYGKDARVLTRYVVRPTATVPSRTPHELAGPCTGLTTNTSAGSYYISGTSQLTDNDLNYMHLPGTPIAIMGFVYAGTDNAKPLAHAKIELWQADKNGIYYPSEQGDATAYLSSQLALRGYIMTDDEGFYRFTSIYPGYYDGRARHIYARISSDGYEPVTTQIILKQNESDSAAIHNDTIAKSLPACHIISLKDNGGIDSGTIDFRLK